MEYQAHPWLFPCLCWSPSIYHCPSRRKAVLFREDKKVAYRAVPAQYSVLSHELIFDACLKYIFIVFLLLLQPFLPSLPSYLNLAHPSSSAASHLLHEAFSIVQPPHSELRTPTWVPREMTHLYYSLYHSYSCTCLPSLLDCKLLRAKDCVPSTCHPASCPST